MHNTKNQSWTGPRWELSSQADGCWGKNCLASVLPCCTEHFIVCDHSTATCPQVSVCHRETDMIWRCNKSLVVVESGGGEGVHLMNHDMRGSCGLFANVAESGLLWPHCGSFNRILFGACSLRGRMGSLNELESAQRALKGRSRVAASVIRG